MKTLIVIGIIALVVSTAIAWLVGVVIPLSPLGKSTWYPKFAKVMTGISVGLTIIGVGFVCAAVATTFLH